MASPNPNYLGVILKASAKTSPAVILWCIAEAWAQVRAQIKRDHLGEVVWMVIDPNDLDHRRAIAYAFAKGKYGATHPNIDFENTYSQIMALMAFYKSQRAVKYEYYVYKMRFQGRESRLSNYSLLSRNEKIPSTSHGFFADSGMVTRTMNREPKSDLYANFGRFFLRQTAELTNADIAALSSGVNNLVMLAHRETGLRLLVERNS